MLHHSVCVISFVAWSLFNTTFSTLLQHYHAVTPHPHHQHKTAASFSRRATSETPKQLEQSCPGKSHTQLPC